jgi:hypothetical protein
VAPGSGTSEVSHPPEAAVAAAGAAQASLYERIEVTDQAAKPRRGCFFYGCITGLVLLVIVLGGLMIGLHYVRKMVNQFTESQPMELPTVQMAPGEIDQLKQRVEAFQKAVKEQRPAEPIVLAADDINALIASAQELHAFKGKFYVSLEGDHVKGDVSVPLNEVGLGIFKGRYLNGSATFNLSFSNGALSVTPQTITVKGAPVPETYMQEIRKQNLATGVTNSPAAMAVLQGLEGIQVKDGKLVAVPKEKK